MIIKEIPETPTAYTKYEVWDGPNQEWADKVCYGLFILNEGEYVFAPCCDRHIRQGVLARINRILAYRNKIYKQLLKDNL